VFFPLMWLILPHALVEYNKVYILRLKFLPEVPLLSQVGSLTWTESDSITEVS
jgi:hypothetical protein